ncbi:MULTISPECIES: TetR/AcrR family transcriptional regulator [Actinomycetes]|uniref:TetR/AcrR family transcriptional regulator n=1 Tax=Actinomycetes TaxID=1760 RepID=UPI0009DFB2DD|nr:MULTISPECIES: TetR/AcrR family transcriptional regulator [Actinomycetes]
MSDGSARRSRGRPPGPGVDPGARREELLDAAEAEIIENGVDFGLAGVAKRAGLTRSAVYAAFADRSDLLAALAQRHTQNLVLEVGTMVNALHDPKEQTRSVIDILARWMEDNSKLAAVLAPRMQVGVGSAEVTGFIEKVLHIALTQLGADARASGPWAPALVGAIWAAVEWWSKSPTMDRAELVDHITSLIWAGFAGVGGERVRLPEVELPLGGDDTPDAAKG